MDRKYLVNYKNTVEETILHMETNAINAVLVVDDFDKLLGVFTPGDLRRYFLCKGVLTASICDAMNPNPIVFKSHSEVKKYEKYLVIFPVVDEQGKVKGVYNEAKVANTSDSLLDVPVVIMAGGKGTRLYPYTKILPKALIPIGEYTISERIIQNFEGFGCNEFFMIINHKAGMIKSYYDDMDKKYNMHFIKEEKFLGTAGGLAYLKGKIDKTFFLSNCDILINSDLECIYKRHKQEGNKITIVCAVKEVEIPYGVIENDEIGTVTNIVEKPSYSFMTNTGLYVVEPEIIDFIDEDIIIHMPEIAQRYIQMGERVGVFPIPEKEWMDMGQFSELKEMMKAFDAQ